MRGWLVADIDAMPKVSSQGPVQGPPLVAELPGPLAVFDEAAVSITAASPPCHRGAAFSGGLHGGGTGFKLEGECHALARRGCCTDLNRLVNTTSRRLCPPPDEDYSPIEVGSSRVDAPGVVELGTGDRTRSGVVDAAARLGFEYSLVDEGWEA